MCASDDDSEDADRRKEEEEEEPPVKAKYVWMIRIHICVVSILNLGVKLHYVLNVAPRSFLKWTNGAHVSSIVPAV